MTKTAIETSQAERAEDHVVKTHEEAVQEAIEEAREEDQDCCSEGAARINTPSRYEIKSLHSIFCGIKPSTAILGSWQPQNTLGLPPRSMQLLSTTPRRAELQGLVAAE